MKENSGDPGKGDEDMIDLVRRAQNGSKEAFVSLIRENRDSLYRGAKAILTREEDVEDAVQETVYRAFYGIGSLRQPKYFKTWIIRILINCCYDFLRRQKGLLPLDALGERGREEERETSMDVRKALSELRENDRLILTLYYLNDLSVKEIGNILHITTGAVKQRLVQSRRRFRQVYEKAEKGGGTP